MLIKVCCECKKIIGVNLIELGEDIYNGKLKISHGYCKYHYDLAIKETNGNKKVGEYGT